MLERSHRRASATIRVLAGALLLGLACAALSGCGTVKQTGTARTGTEQILLSNAWDEALQRVDFRPLTGVPVYLDTANLNGQLDQGWIVSSLRQAMLSQGVLLRSKPEQAQWIVEPSVGAYGTDAYNWLVGVQQMTMPVAVPGLPTGTIPEMPFIKKSDQHAVAKLSLFAYERSSGQLVWRSGTQLATANAKDVYVGGVGPIQSGTIRPPNKKIGINVPLITDPFPTTAPRDASKRAGSAGEPGIPAATMALPPSAADLESFAPDGR
jgi:hypothetical protein